MNKSVYGHKLGRTSHQRKALFRSLISSLIEKGQIKTTLVKAKSVKSQAERLITRAKKGTLNDRRVIFRFLYKKSLVDDLVDRISPGLAKRNSGYLKILKLERRKGDDTPMALLSFVDELPAVAKPEKKVVKEVAKEEKKVVTEKK